MRRSSVVSGLVALGLVIGSGARAAEPLVVEAIVSAPVTTVWQAFATREGYAAVGVPHSAVDLRMGGLLQVQPAAAGTLGDAGTTVSEIVSFEPERLLSTRVKTPPAGFGDAQAFANTWSIIYLSPLGPDMTHVRIAGFGFNEGRAAPELTRFFEQDHVAQLRRIEKHYWPLCALCKTEGQ